VAIEPACGNSDVGGAVAEHDPEKVEAAPGQGEHGLGVGLAFGALSVVVGPGGGQLFRAERSDR